MNAVDERLDDPDAVGLPGSPHVDDGRVQPVEDGAFQHGSRYALEKPQR